MTENTEDVVDAKFITKRHIANYKTMCKELER